MAADHLHGIEKFGADVWKIADNLRGQCGDRGRQGHGKMPDHPLVDADFTRRRALNLPESARFDVILKTPKEGSLGAALNAAMEAIEAAFPPFANLRITFVKRLQIVI